MSIASYRAAVLFYVQRVDVNKFTVCDNAAAEACPVWPGKPITAHWGIPDPAAAEGSEAERRDAFRQAFATLEGRLKPFLKLTLAQSAA